MYPLNYPLNLSNRGARTAYGSHDISRQVAGADRHQLISILYDEVEMALEAMPVARCHHRYAMYAERQARVLAILNGLENALDFAAGRQLAEDLATVYRAVRHAVLTASRTKDDAPLITARNMIGTVADAWLAIGAR